MALDVPEEVEVVTAVVDADVLVVVEVEIAVMVVMRLVDTEVTGDVNLALVVVEEDEVVRVEATVERVGEALEVVIVVEMVVVEEIVTVAVLAATVDV